MTEQPTSKIFTPRRAYKPFEYPEAMKFVELMQQSYWVHSEVNFDPDIQDFKSSLYPYEQEAIKRALLGIAQVEVSVKTFWGDLYDLFPKPEFNCLGMSFGESETRHSEAYSRLLEVLGYEQEFETLLNIPIFQRREEIIKHKLKATNDTLEKILFFTLIIENASLFSQFATILSMTKFKGKLKATANMIAWTSIDENCHANAGTWIINQVLAENPHLRPTLEEYITSEVIEYMQMEDDMIDWIFEQGELQHLSKQHLKDYMRYRIDTALENLGFTRAFHTTSIHLEPMLWFEEEVFSGETDDFFAKRPTAYTKHNQSITKDDLF